MSNHHHIIRPTSWLTPEGWDALEPVIDSMPTNGGCVCLVFDSQADCRNYLHTTIATFTAKERTALRKAILKARQQQEAQSQG